MKGTGWLGLAALVLLGGCRERLASPPLAQSTSAPPLASAPPEATVVEVSPPSPVPKLQRTWQEAVRVEQWATAASLFDELPEAERAPAPMRYVRARIALALGDGEVAVKLLENLEADWPDIAPDVARHRAEAQLIAGPYAAAAEFFGKSPKARDMAKAAEALAKAGQFDKARAMADRGVQVAQRVKSKRDEAVTRMARARVRREKLGDAAAEPDLRWVAVHMPQAVEGREAIATLDRIKHPLTQKERTQAIDALLDAASPDAAREIERAAKATPPASAQELHAKAVALFRARTYVEAAKAFDASAARHAATEAEDLYYAGRSLARAGKGEEAVKRLDAVATRFKGGPFFDKASYLSARMALDAGRFDDAAAAYDRYLKGFRKPERKADATYERALAQLSSSAPKAAQKSLRDLMERAKGDDVGKLKELEGVAAMRAGDRDRAVALWTEVAKAQPMSWAALASRARLTAAGAAVPPLLEAPRGSAQPPLAPKLPPVVAALADVGLDADAEAYLLAREREASAGYGDRGPEALCTLYGQLGRAKRRFRLGQRAVGLPTLYRAPSLAERWAWECVYPQPYAAHVRALEDDRQIPHGFVYALMRQESAFDPAIVSPAAAIGLMQLMPATAKQCADEIARSGKALGDAPAQADGPVAAAAQPDGAAASARPDLAIFDAGSLTSPDVNLRLGVFYIGKLLKMFDGNVLYAAAAYNAGPKAVANWVTGKEKDADLWVARIPYDETRNYVAKVAGNLARYQYLQGGEAAVSPVSLAMAEPTVPEDAY